MSVPLLRRLAHHSLVGSLLLLLVACGAAPLAPLPTQPLATPTPQPTATTAPLVMPTAANQVSGMIVVDGSSTVFPITEAAASAFRRAAPAVQFQIGVSGTGGGFRTFCAAESDLSNASRPINASEAAECAANGVEYLELPVAFDGLSVVIHPENSWATCLSVAELAQIWSPVAEGQVMRWRDVRPEWPDEPLALYGPGQDSGTYDYFTSAVVGEEGVSRQDYTASEDDYLLAQDVSENPYGLGFFGYAYYAEYRDQLQLAAIDSGEGCQLPSDEAIADGTYEPLARPIFIYVNRQALARPELAAFVASYLANAPQLVSQVGYTPLSAAIYELVVARYERRQVGSVFDGGAQVGVSLEDLLRLER